MSKFRQYNRKSLENNFYLKKICKDKISLSNKLNRLQQLSEEILQSFVF